MEDDQRSELTNLLDAARLGEPVASDRLTQAVYAELRRMAGKLMR
jgi:ECF sigma factor